jgi:hypothetical protein
MLQLITTKEELQTTINTAVLEAYKQLSLGAEKETIEIIDGKTLMERLNISEPTLIRWRKKLRIPYLQIGSSIRYDWYKVLNSLEKKKGGPQK